MQIKIRLSAFGSLPLSFAFALIILGRELYTKGKND
jgi:hypothetical protein